MTPVLQSAIELANSNFAVHFQNGKRAVEKGWNTGPAKTPDQLTNQYRPGLNVAVRTGQYSLGGLVVVDVDIRSEEPLDKREAWAEFKRLTGGDYITTKTGGGGMHAFFKCPADKLPSSNSLTLAHGRETAKNKYAWAIEVLSNGHAATVPPSVHDKTGNSYQWVNGGAAHIPDIPQCLLNAIAERRVNEAGRPDQGTNPAWPDPLDDAAYCGLAGEIARHIEPQTESDAAAVLLQILVCFGALVGRGPHVRVEGDQHHTNLDILIIGNTSKARKGTSWGRVREVFEAVADWPQWVAGLSSGEGLKYAVRDPVKRTERDKKTGFSKEVEVDSGVADKRLLVVESEFSQVLKQTARAGNTLSATIRSAWDTGNLSTLTKNDPVKATGAHICIIGHITADELRAELTATDAANGFANRFLFMCAKRSKSLAFGGLPIDATVLADFASRIATAVVAAKALTAVSMTGAARDMWARVYPVLSEGYTGLLGAVTARAEAQTLRLALVFALMDEAEQIDAKHMTAALAVWERSAASAQHIFGAALGDPVADEILRSLRVAKDAGVTRTEIRNLFAKHQSAERIGAALELLDRHGLARSIMRPTPGRDAEVWICV